MTLTFAIKPDLLRWALDRADWSESTAAKRFPRFPEWIRGEAEPTLNQIEKFASATYTPFGMLFLDEPPQDTLPIPDMRTVADAEILRPSANLLDTIYLCQQRQEWYRTYAEDVGLPAADVVGTARIEHDPHHVARAVRSYLGYEVADREKLHSADEARAYLVSKLEGLGILVMINGVVGNNAHRKLDVEEFRGFALADNLAPLIFVNGADSKAAQIFTLVHEFAHLLLGHSALSDADLSARVDEERWCNSVAAEVLVPMAEVKAHYVGSVEDDKLERLARKYHASTLVILRRLRDSQLISDSVYWRRLKEETDRVLALKAQSGTPGGGNFYHTQRYRLGALFAQALLSSTYTGSTSFGEASHLLGIQKQQTIDALAREAEAW